MMPWKAVISAFAAVLLATGAAAAEDRGFDWPRWRGPEGNGISLETGWNPKALAGGPRVLWELDIGRGYANVAIREKRVYSLGSVGNCNVVHCLDADTGNAVWKHSFVSSEEPQATPTVDGDAVYALSKDGILLCLDACCGKLRWQRDLTADFGAMEPYYGFSGSPVIEKDWVILTANTSGLALKKSTGDLAWKSRQVPVAYPTWTDRPAGTDYATPVVFSHQRERYALISSCNGLHAVHVATGRALWVYKWNCYNGGLTVDPLLSGHLIYVDGDSTTGGTPTSLLLDVDAPRPRVLWRSPDLVTDMTNPVLVGGYIYGCNGGPSLSAAPASLRCLELETGRLMWQDTLGEPPRKGVFSLMAADGKLIVLNDKGMLRIAEASPVGFRPISSADVLRGKQTSRRFYTPPVLCNGRIYCRNYAGELTCIDVRK